MLCQELDAGTILGAKEYPNTSDGVKTIVDVFKTQFAAYARGEYPFIVQTNDSASLDGLKFRRKLSKHPDACFLAVSDYLFYVPTF